MSNEARTTKKVILASGVVLAFIAYTTLLRGQRSTPVIAPAPSPKAGSSSTPGTSGGTGNTPTASYKDGAYTGDIANAYYGNVQVEAVITGGKITAVQFLQYPNDNPNSQYINSQATPYLKQEAIQAQNANVNIVTGATLTSQAFIESLSSALNQAKA